MPLITCEKVALGYEGRRIAEDITFSVEKGDYLCIVGENGSGKSTLMKALLHLQKPLAGTISMEDGLPQGSIGYLPQQTLIQRDFPASVQEVVFSGCLNRSGIIPFYSRKLKERAFNIMEQTGIVQLRRRCYRELSGGQQQRVLLSRALCAADTLLLLDEPTAGLDTRSTEDMYSLVQVLNKEHGMSIIMISHDVVTATQYASHVLHLGPRPLFYGTASDYVTHFLDQKK